MFLIFAVEDGKLMCRRNVTDEIRRAVSSYGHDIAAYIHGSEARGDARPDSDIDLPVVVEKDNVSLEDEMRMRKPGDPIL